jgi:hypothetical protein
MAAAAPNFRAWQHNMQAARIPVDVIMERVPLHNRWVSERWLPVAVVAASAHATRGAFARLAGEVERWRCGSYHVELHPSEAEGYYLNLTATEPKAFVLWRIAEQDEPAARPVIVTVSYNEAARFLDGGEQVEGVPLPELLADVMRPFIALHYKPEPRRKARRNDAPSGADDPRRR